MQITANQQALNEAIAAATLAAQVAGEEITAIEVLALAHGILVRATSHAEDYLAIIRRRDQEPF